MTYIADMVNELFGLIVLNFNHLAQSRILVLEHCAASPILGLSAFARGIIRFMILIKLWIFVNADDFLLLFELIFDFLCGVLRDIYSFMLLFE